MVVVQRVSQEFLTRLVTDGEFLTRLDALEVVVQGVLCHVRVRWAVYRVGFAEFHVSAMSRTVQNRRVSCHFRRVSGSAMPSSGQFRRVS